MKGKDYKRKNACRDRDRDICRILSVLMRAF